MDWLDAGYWMLIDGLDADARALLDDLFDAETEAQMLDRFQALRYEMDARAAERAAAEAKARRHRKPGERSGPIRRVPEGAIEAAADEWDAIIAAAQDDETTRQLVLADE